VVFFGDCESGSVAPLGVRSNSDGGWPQKRFGVSRGVLCAFGGEKCVCELDPIRGRAVGGVFDG
jgi:hypothetical protein